MNNSESAFARWLDQNLYPWFYIDQLPVDHFSSFFRENKISRPDFLIFIPQISAIAIDVKERKFIKDFHFYLSEQEVFSLSKFEKLAKISTWIAFFNQGNYDTCFFTTISDFIECNPKTQKLPSGDIGYHIPIGNLKRLELQDPSKFTVFVR